MDAGDLCQSKSLIVRGSDGAGVVDVERSSPAEY